MLTVLSAKPASAVRLTGAVVQALLSNVPFSRTGMARQAQHFSQYSMCYSAVLPRDWGSWAEQDMTGRSQGSPHFLLLDASQ
jgi:hypothetical protein